MSRKFESTLAGWRLTDPRGGRGDTSGERGGGRGHGKEDMGEGYGKRGWGGKGGIWQRGEGGEGGIGPSETYFFFPLFQKSSLFFPFRLVWFVVGLGFGCCKEGERERERLKGGGRRRGEVRDRGGRKSEDCLISIICHCN